jgi:hypothetical protein
VPNAKEAIMVVRSITAAMMSAGLLAAGAARADVAVYSDALIPGWDNWSWGTTINFANASPAYGGSGASISVRYTAAWAGLYLHSGAVLNAADFSSLHFVVHGGTAGGQVVNFIAYDAAGAPGASVAVPAPAAGTWASVDIPIAALGVQAISGLVWQDGSGSPTGQPTFYLDNITLIAGPPPAAPSISVDTSAGRYAISPLIYGMNFADEALAAELRLPVNRWGGNSTTRYNWRLDTSNHANDWYFENIPEDNAHPELLPDGSSSDRFVEQNRRTGTDSLVTIPLIGWTPRARAYAGGFSVSRYGPQQSVDPYRPDIGNGVRPDGTLIVGNDPADTSIAIDPTFVRDWIGHLIARYGAAGAGGVRYYNLDNEPMLWNSTHRDVHPQPPSYDELRNQTLAYAAAVKQADPAARTLGPAEWGWTGYFYSALDQAAGGSWWDTRPDRRAHGDVPLSEWYLQQMRAAEQSGGVRLLDYFDLHYYPQANNVALEPAGDAATQALRLRSTRSLWDPTYVDESWIADTIRLIPRMREWVAADYPGTMIAIGEYNWGGLEDINGALAQADVLGIFGREGVDLATIWSAPSPGQPGAFAFRMYRNYDGSGGAFGSTAVRANSSDQSRVSAYAAADGRGALNLMLINKAAGSLACPLTLLNLSPSGPARAYRYSAADLSRVVRGPDVSITPSGSSITLPGSSITLLVIPGGCPADFNGDGTANVADFLAYLAAFAAADPRADQDGNGAVNVADFLAFLRAYAGGCP